jgi:aromatic-L-amino-acid/L-tryptophan decarboxylase
VGIEVAMEQALTLVAPYGTGNLSPRFWGWVLGAGNLPGLLGQWLASSMNANVFGGAQAPVELEQRVLGWFRDWFEFPAGASGILLEGASSANLYGLAIARHRASAGQVKAEGLFRAAPLRLYCSTATHVSIIKAAELLGLGRHAVHQVPTLPDGSVDLALLERAIEEDRSAGYEPFCIVGSAGTVGTGAIDPLHALRELSTRHGLWLHVDGAIGALGQLSPALRPRLLGLTLADSLAFDLHKWGQVPYDAGCLLVRDGALHRAAFAAPAEYLSTLPGGVVPHGSHAFNDLGTALSRGDRALKIWMTFMALGTDRVRQVFEQNVSQARFLADLISQSDELELLNDVALNIVCFRFRVDPTHGVPSDTVHERILVALQESGFCVLSPYRISGRVCLRVALSNHRTRRADLNQLVGRVLELGRRFAERVASP